MNIPKYEIKYKGKNFLANSKELMFANIEKYLGNRSIDFDKEELLGHINKNIKVNSAFGGSSNTQEKKLNKVYKPRLTFKDVVNGAKALLGLSIGDAVDQNEVTRRGRICASCPRMTLTTDCYGCGFAGTLNKFIGGLKGLFGKELSLNADVKGGYCDICSCALSIMIPSKLDKFNESEEKQSQRPDFCWLKKSSENFFSQ